MAGKTLPAPLILVIQGWRGRVGIGVGSLMLPPVAHRGKVLPAQGTTVLPLEGRDGQSPSRTTRTCDPGVEGARWDPYAFADASAGCSQRYNMYRTLPTVSPLEGRGGQSPSRTTPTCDPGAEGARTLHNCLTFRRSWRAKLFPHHSHL
jgi:hypothetical protein